MDINNQQRDLFRIVKIMLVVAAVLEAAYLILNRISSVSNNTAFQFSDVLQFTGLGLMIAIAVLFIRSAANRTKSFNVLMFLLGAVLYFEVINSMSTVVQYISYYGSYSGAGFELFGIVDGFLEAFLVITVAVAVIDETKSLYMTAMITGWVTLACEVLFCLASVYKLIAGNSSVTTDVWNSLSTICYGPAWIIFEGAWIIICAKKLKEFSQPFYGQDETSTL